ncbi:MAG: RNA polymerase sigma factor [Desulforhopalus sp.]
MSSSQALSFSSVYDEFYTKILHYLKRLVGEFEAEEVAQTVFEKISRNLSSFKGDSKLSTWVYRVATNTALDRLKSQSFKYSFAGPLAPLPLNLPEAETPVSATSRTLESPDKKVIQNEMSECVREFVDRLPPEYRTIIVLNEFEGLSNKEIAEVLEISIDSAKIRLHRARKRLKESLAAGCDFYVDERSVLACDRKQHTQKK